MSVQRTGLLFPLHKQLQASFDFTPRQAEVAQFLAQRKTNREVAEALCISPHTARHHTEAVLAKLEVGSRRDVAPRLRRS